MMILATNQSYATFAYSIGSASNSEAINFSGSDLGGGRIRFSGLYKTDS